MEKAKFEEEIKKLERLVKRKFLFMGVVKKFLIAWLSGVTGLVFILSDKLAGKVPNIFSVMSAMFVMIGFYVLALLDLISYVREVKRDEAGKRGKG